MDRERLLARLDEARIVRDEGKWVSLSPQFEERVETYRRFVAQTPPGDLANRLSETFTDLPAELPLTEGIKSLSIEVLACYLAVRTDTELQDTEAMVAAGMVKTLITSEQSRCRNCGFTAPAEPAAWDRVVYPILGTLTRCPECDSTDVIQLE